jgi:SAM-dependent methyltransferase
MNDVRGEYDAGAAKRYTTVDDLPIRGYAEVPTFLDALGDVTGNQVLDLACGSGFLTRLISAHGAARVVGVDSSASMIKLGRAALEEDQSIEYHVHDVASLPWLGEFDAVTAGFLLNYSGTRSELTAMCERVIAHLRPGGRFVGSVPDSTYDRHRLHDARYGVTYEWLSDMDDGDRFTFRFHHLDPPLSLECYYWRNETYQRALEDAGFREVRFRPWQPSRAGIESLGEEFWAPWTANPMISVFSCTKPGLDKP